MSLRIKFAAVAYLAERGFFCASENGVKFLILLILPSKEGQKLEPRKSERKRGITVMSSNL